MFVARCFNFFFEGLGLELVASLFLGGLLAAGLVGLIIEEG